jgi:hypothetical protein
MGLTSLMVTRGAVLRLVRTNATLLSITGDGTGLVRVENGSRLMLQAGFTLRAATLRLGQSVLISPADLTVQAGGTLILQENGRSSGLPLGHYYFNTLTLRPGARVSKRSLGTSLTTPIVMYVDTLNVASGATIEANAAGSAGGVAAGSPARGG